MESAFSPHAGRTPAEHAGIRNDAAGSRRRDVAAFPWNFGGPELHSAAVLGLPAMIALCVCIAMFRDYIGTALASHYWASLITSANSFILAICPIAAGCAAWDAGSLRRGRVLAYPSAISRTAVLSRAAMPSLASGWLCLLGAWLFMLPSASGAPTAADIVTLCSGPVIVLAYVMFGLMLGLLIPGMFSVPAALFLAYCWMVLPSAVEPLWLRHLNGFEDGCCLPDTALSLSASFAPLIIAIGVNLMCALLAAASVRAMVVGWRSHDRTIAGCSVCAIVALCAAVAVAVPLVLPFGAYPVIARTTSTVCDRRDGITVCVWPEHRNAMSRFFQPAADLSGILGRNGYVTPAKLSESPADHTAWLFSAEDSEQLSGDEIASYLLSGLLTYDTTQNGCEILDTQARDYQVAELWMTNAAGLHEDGEDGPAADTVPADVAEQFTRLAAKSRNEQARWVADTMHRLRGSCGME
ncbi:MAG: hypothetical protein EGS39_11465 [Bifidobacterium bifidum]|nr:hypothetical protein [Bifidobacterium bifidum]